MDIHELPFGKIIILQEDVAEVIIDEGVEMNAPMVEEYHAFLLSHLSHPFSLLINKINSYTYDFDALLGIASLNEILSMAVVHYTRSNQVGTEILAAINPNSDKWNLKMFWDREKALAWLFNNQENTTAG